MRHIVDLRRQRDEERDEIGRLRSELAVRNADYDRLYRETVKPQSLELERLRAVTEAAREVATHDCQVCREHWDDQREAGVMRLAQALDKIAPQKDTP